MNNVVKTSSSHWSYRYFTLPLRYSNFMFLTFIHAKPKTDQKIYFLQDDTMVILKTNHGDIKLAMFADAAPNTVANFLSYVEEGFYNGTVFHRVISNFMVQGGGFEPGLEQKTPKAAIENEADNGKSNKIGTLAMARTSDPHSATAQFFINVKDNDFLDFTAANSQGYGYCVFAEVVEGMDIVEKIKGVTTGNMGMHQDVPLEDVVLESAEIVE